MEFKHIVGATHLTQIRNYSFSFSRYATRNSDFVFLCFCKKLMNFPFLNFCCIIFFHALNSKFSKVNFLSYSVENIFPHGDKEGKFWEKKFCRATSCAQSPLVWIFPAFLWVVKLWRQSEHCKRNDINSRLVLLLNASPLLYVSYAML